MLQDSDAIETLRKRVFVAEDDENLCELVVQTLVGQGMEVATAGNGAQALASIMEGRFDAAVIDVVMPGMSGLAVLGALRRSGNRTPVLITSGYLGMLEENRFIQMGAARVFKKPFSMEELAQAVSDLAAESSTDRPAD